MSGLRNKLYILKTLQIKDFLILLILALTLALYLILSSSTGTADVDYFAAWSRESVHGNLFAIYQLGLSETYSYPVGSNLTSTYPYPPFGVYLLTLFGLFTSSIAGDNISSFTYAANFLSVTSIFSISYALFRNNKEKTFQKRIRDVALFLVNPFTILLYCLLGYQDAVVCAFLVFSLLMARERKYMAVGIFFALAIWTKQLSWILAIPVLPYLFRIGTRAARKFISGFVFTSIIILSPFIFTGNLFLLFQMLIKGSVHQVYSANAYNLPWLVGMLMQEDSIISALQLPSQSLTSDDFNFIWFSSAYSFFESVYFLLIFISIIWIYRMKIASHIMLMYLFILFPVMYYIFAPGVHENHLLFILPIFLLWRNSLAFTFYFIFTLLISINCFMRYGIGRKWTYLLDLPPLTYLNSNLIGIFLFVGTLTASIALFREILRESKRQVI